ncbi:hypothetical protein AB996_1012 [Lactococcus cremoris]|uniref:Uncharacterized protein n=1 Tax=Lactococcus lactis subsp. cremoris TaxID=1359 RepID=A0A161U0T0_LACLC|nr:hypothetical protein AB996_1012 [Lactococcus cremoris]
MIFPFQYFISLYQKKLLTSPSAIFQINYFTDNLSVLFYCSIFLRI